LVINGFATPLIQCFPMVFYLFFRSPCNIQVLIYGCPIFSTILLSKGIKHRGQAKYVDKGTALFTARIKTMAITKNAKIKEKLYIDSDGLMRGYYVYLHKDRETGEVFYVGKGHEKRAWQTTGRNDLWNKKVTALVNGWDVEIVQLDLTENEAFALEDELVEKYGRCAAEGGALTNWTPGGESPVSIKFSLEIPGDGGWTDKYHEVREFKKFSRDKEETIIKAFNNELKLIYSSVQQLAKEARELFDDELSESVNDLEDTISFLLDAITEFIRRRMSWKDLAIEFEEQFDQLEMMIDDIVECHKVVRPLLQQTHKSVSKIMSLIDSGNRKTAESIATQMATIPAAESGDVNAQARLGYFYGFGCGVPQDDVQAYKWYKIALSLGYSDSLGLVDIVKGNLTPDQIVEAESLSKAWLNRKGVLGNGVNAAEKNAE